MQFGGYYFRPSWIVTLATIVVVASLAGLGVWQWQRADKNQAIEDFKEIRARMEPLKIGAMPVDGDAMRGRKVSVRGNYETQYQFFLDNQVYGGADALPGYHVITPLHIEGGEMRVLVNRGWVRMGFDRSKLPEIETPLGTFDIVGYAMVPRKQYMLKPEVPIQGQWSPVWEAIDIPRFAAAVAFPVQPLVIQLDAESTAGGFVRDWQRGSVLAKKNIGYSLQWFAMAVTILVIFVAVNLKKIPNGGKLESE